MTFLKIKNCTKIFSLIFFLLISTSLVLPLSARAEESANTSGSFFEQSTGLKETAEKTGHTKQKLFGSAESIEVGAGTIINVALSFVGVIFMGLLVFSGMMWMTAGGNEQRVERSKTTIIRSLVGLAIILLAYAVSYFLINALSGKSLLG